MPVAPGSGMSNSSAARAHLLSFASILVGLGLVPLESGCGGCHTQCTLSVESSLACVSVESSPSGTYRPQCEDASIVVTNNCAQSIRVGGRSVPPGADTRLEVDQHSGRIEADAFEITAEESCE